MSNLLKMNLAIESDTLKKRVHAAVVQTAHQQKNRPDARGGFARIVLADLKSQYPDFILEVAANTDVQAALALSDENQYVVATNVTDEQIVQIVNGIWATAASKYAPPTPGDGE